MGSMRMVEHEGGCGECLCGGSWRLGEDSKEEPGREWG